MGFDEVRGHLVEQLAQIVGLLEKVDDDGWSRRTRCPGWRVRDAAWHIAWGEGPGEVIEAASLGLDPPAYATSRMGATPSDPREIVAAARHKLERTRADLATLTPDDAGFLVRYGGESAEPERLHEHLWAQLVEAVVHCDDVATALDLDEAIDHALAEEVVQRRMKAAIAIAARDLLQPTASRGYRYAAAGQFETGFIYAGGAWRVGVAASDASVPTCSFEADPTTLVRLVMGRIPVTPYDASPGRPWDERLRLSGDVRGAPPSDVTRWCYGTW